MAAMQPGTNPRLQALQNLSSQLPVANSQVAKGQQAARQMQIQQAVSAAPKSGNTAGMAQKVAGASAENAGQQAIQNAQNVQQTTGQMGQQALAEQQQQGQSQINSAAQGVNQLQMQNAQALANLDSRAKGEVYDKQMQFQKDQAGRAVFTQRQLADYAALKATSEQDFKNKAQMAQQASDRQLQAMEVAFKNVTEDLNHQYEMAKAKGDFDTASRITTLKNHAAETMDQARARRANNVAMYGAGGTIIGGVVGAVIGGYVSGGTGAAAGGAAGAGVGGALGAGVGAQQPT